MAIFLPTDSNVHALKHLLMTDFEMKSSHASETIAALIGFNTHSAFLSHRDSKRGPYAFEVDFDRFVDRSAALGYCLQSCDYLRFIFRNLDHPEPAWRMFEKSDRDGRDDWFYDCQRRGVPFIQVLKARKYFTVEWDHISTDSSYDNLARTACSGELHQVLFRNFQLICRGTDDKSFFDGGAMVGWVKGLSETSGRQIANMLALHLWPGNLHELTREAA